MSSGGRSAEHQAAAEHSLEGQHLMQHLLGQREVLLQELCDKSGTDIKWPPCANPSTPVMDENLTPDAQLSVIEFMLEQRPRPCRRDRQPVELVIVVNAADEGKLAREFRVYSSLTRQTFLALEEQVASLQRKLAESEAAVEVQRSRALASEEQVASNTAVRARRLVAAPSGGPPQPLRPSEEHAGRTGCHVQAARSRQGQRAEGHSLCGNRYGSR